jgi:hypothetical protein
MYYFCFDVSSMYEKELLWHVRASMYALIEKKVILSLRPLFEADSLEMETKRQLNCLFPMFASLDIPLPSFESLVMHAPTEIEDTLEANFEFVDQEGINSKRLGDALKLVLKDPLRNSGALEDSIMNHISQCEDIGPSVCRIIDAFGGTSEANGTIEVLDRLLNALRNSTQGARVNLFAFRHCMEKEYYWASFTFRDSLFEVLKVSPCVT